MVLGRIEVAGGPAHIGAKGLQCLDQHRRLNGHVQRACDAGVLERLSGPELLADRHQARHFRLGHVDLFAAPIGETDILDHIILSHLALPALESAGVLSAASYGLNASHAHISKNLWRYAPGFMRAHRRTPHPEERPAGPRLEGWG